MNGSDWGVFETQNLEDTPNVFPEPVSHLFHSYCGLKEKHIKPSSKTIITQWQKLFTRSIDHGHDCDRHVKPEEVGECSEEASHGGERVARSETSEAIIVVIMRLRYLAPI